ncbi:hypothetical protein V5N11_022898 [Cardamine amara subsp. amara]|uniref:Aspartic peptidase DDI1-type domain-containing protein n=1 Tax=Cardamine amara subsp. amara TaxID=228776 RepID=A0ABD0ZPY7_CARAN
MELTTQMTAIHNKVDGVYQDLNAKYESLSSQVAQMSSSSSKRPIGVLPGKSETNPKEYANAITLRCGKKLPSGDSNVDNAKEKGEIVIEIEDEIGIVKDEEGLKEKVEDAGTYVEKVVLEKGKGKAVEEVTKDNIGVIAPKTGSTFSKKETLFVPPPYEPKLPFPGRFKKQLMEKYRAMFDKQMKEVTVTMSLLDAFVLSPPYNKFLKDAVREKKNQMESMVLLTHECSAIIQRKVIAKKKEDPGSFTLPCSLGPLSFSRCLCDLGASVSLMPLSVAKRLGFTRYKDCRISLVLADRSIRTPIGLLEDLPVMVGHFQIPTDFIVLEMDEEPMDPLILGRPFLRTAGSLIDVEGGKINLRLGREVLTFDINRVLRKPTIEGQMFYIEEMNALADELLEEITLEDSLQSTLTVKKGEFGLLEMTSEGYEKILDSHLPSCEDSLFIELNEERYEVALLEASNGKSSTEGDWSELKAPQIDLKPLPKGLRYAFLGSNDTYSVIISDELNEVETSALLGE